MRLTYLLILVIFKRPIRQWHENRLYINIFTIFLISWGQFLIMKKYTKDTRERKKYIHGRTKALPVLVKIRILFTTQKCTSKLVVWIFSWLFKLKLLPERNVISDCSSSIPCVKVTRETQHYTEVHCLVGNPVWTKFYFKWGAMVLWAYSSACRSSRN